MNKNELIDAIAGGSGLSKADAGRALEAFLGSVQSTLASGGSVKITGFGTFSVSHRAATNRKKIQELVKLFKLLHLKMQNLNLVKV